MISLNHIDTIFAMKPTDRIWISISITERTDIVLIYVRCFLKRDGFHMGFCLVSVVPFIDMVDIQMIL